MDLRASGPASLKNCGWGTKSKEMRGAWTYPGVIYSVFHYPPKFEFLVPVSEIWVCSSIWLPPFINTEWKLRYTVYWPLFSVFVSLKSQTDRIMQHLPWTYCGGFRVFMHNHVLCSVWVSAKTPNENRPIQHAFFWTYWYVSNSNVMPFSCAALYSDFSDKWNAPGDSPLWLMGVRLCSNMMKPLKRGLCSGLGKV